MALGVPSPNSDLVTTVTAPVDLGTRLAMKPAGSVKGFFDGGWWPRTYEPVAEFSALLHSLQAELGPVDRIGYSMSTWDLVPRRLVVDRRTVRLEGFRSLDRNTVILIGLHIHRLTLLVVPPAAGHAAATRALAAAAAPDNDQSGTDILESSGVLIPEMALVPAQRERTVISREAG